MVLEVVKVHVRAKFHQAKCSGSWVINSAQTFGRCWKQHCRRLHRQ